jgi:curli biogenesis system outer membrane secretion channel CsgG
MKNALILAALLAASGCAALPPGDKPVEVARGPLPSRASTPMEPALACVRAALPAGLDLRLAVQSIPDRTGVVDYDGPGSYVTQGAELMMVSALARSGVRQVNRTATNIAEWELQQAMEKRLGEGGKVRVGDTAVAFRPVQVGGLLGSTHTVYGGITELDFDLQSGGAEAHIAGFGGKARGYYIGVGLDLAVADTRSTEVVMARSYRKQIWGQELEANLFRFWDIGNGGDGIGDVGTELFDIRIGKQQNEPIHQSVRWVVEMAAYEIVRDLAGLGDRCDRLVPEGSRSAPAAVALASLGPAATVSPTEAAPSPASAPATTSGAPAAKLDDQEPAAARGVRLPDGTVLPVQGR